MGKLYNKLEEYNNQNYCPMHMPGHKRNTKLLGKKLPYNIDITEINGFDDLHHPEEIIKEIEDRAQKLYKSKRSFILVNGSTCGILAGIRSAVKQHNTILVARNCHKSVYHAIELNELNPVYLLPSTSNQGINLEILPSDVEKAIQQNKNIKLLVLTSPTYEGVISNLKGICDIAHKYNIPVLVDEAHGAHLKFVKELEQYSALEAGADIVIQSLHKTLPALTQTAVLHVKGDLIKENEVARQLSIFETSSPSYILMSSIDECLNILEKNGKELFEEYDKNLKEFYEKAKSLKNLQILGNIIDKNIIYDEGKIVILTNNTNITGAELAEILRQKYKIEIEMSYVNYVIAMTSICDEKENFERLLSALKEIDKTLECQSIKEKHTKIEIPESELSIYEAIQSPREDKIEYKKAEGKISKEYIWVYPPGIPIITPGEVIRQNIIEKLEEIQKSGLEIRTTNNEFPTITII